MEVTFRGNNLYRNGEISEFKNGEHLLTRAKLVITQDMIEEYHTLIASDDLSLLAYKKYGKIVPDASKFWWVIADANEAIVNPLDLSDVVGQLIAIPDIRKVILLIQ